MLKLLLASTLVVGALTLPAMADGPVDYRTVGGAPYGYQDARPGWQGQPGPGGDARQGDWGQNGGDWRMPPWRLMRVLAWRGYDDLSIIDQKRDVTILRARDRGRPVMLVVDARSGSVLRERPMGGFGPGFGWGGPGRW